MGIFDWLFKGGNNDIEKYENRKQRLNEKKSTLKKTKSKKNKDIILINNAQSPWGKGGFKSRRGFDRYGKPIFDKNRLKDGDFERELGQNIGIYNWTENELYLFYTLVMDLAYAATEEELISIESGETGKTVMDMLEKNPQAGGLLKTMKEANSDGSWFGIHNLGLELTMKYWFNNDNAALDHITDALEGFNLNLSKSKFEEFQKRRGTDDQGVRALSKIELNHLKIIEKLSIVQRDNLVNGLIWFALIADNGITARSAGGIMQIGKKLNVDYDKLKEFFIKTLEIPENVFKEFEHSLINI